LPQRVIDSFLADCAYGYDISNDLNYICYSDSEGLHLMDLSNGNCGLLVETIPAEHPFPDNDWAGPSYHHFMSPRFIASDTKIITTLSGYEGNHGYLIYDLNKQNYERIGSYESISTQYISINRGMLMDIFAPYQEGQNDFADYSIKYLDFDSNQVLEINEKLIGSLNDFLREPNSIYVNSGYGAFLTYSADMKKTYIHRIDLKTMEIEPNILSIEGARVALVGILTDGRVIFSYYRTTAEQGIGITLE